MTPLQHFRRLFDYEMKAHDKMLASLRDAAPAHAAKPEFRQALSLAEHLVAARLIWLGRFGEFTNAPTMWFPDTAKDIGDVERAFARMHDIWSAYLARIEESELQREVEYRSLTDDGRFRDVVENILFQMFGHSFYHRGQIALLVRKMGAEPAATDLVYWTREAV